MTAPLLTIAEASEKTGRSHSTIRRLIRQITDVACHPDRSGVEPKTSEVTAYKKKGENFTWKIREDVLFKHFRRALHEGKKDGKSEVGGILDVLRGELELKNEQIEKQWEVIHALNDRLREGNILMGSLQQRLALPIAPSATASTLEAAPTDASMPSPESPSTAAPVHALAGVSKAPAMKASKKSSRKGIFRWILR